MESVMGLVLGLLAAWLVNYLADILPAQRKLGKPACPSCGTEYRLAGYFSLAACTHCKAPRSWRTYIVLAAGLVLGAVVFLFPPAFGPWIALLLLTYFGVVTVIDVEHRIIMHVTSLAGVLIGLPVGIFLHEPVLTLLGGLVGGGIMLVFYLAGVAFARYRARKLGHDDGEEALGFGDVTIATVLGLMVGCRTSSLRFLSASFWAACSAC
jgi:prepilin signal peptidase PulO-like enzyme (type II secretory pathway)